MFELTNPDSNHRPDKLNRLYAELKRIALVQNAYTAMIDPDRRYILGIMNVGYTEQILDFAPRLVTEITVATFLDASQQLDLFSKTRQARRYVFREDGTVDVYAQSQKDRRFSTASDGLEDLLLHIEHGVRLIIEDAQSKLRSLASTRESLRRSSHR